MFANIVQYDFDQCILPDIVAGTALFAISAVPPACILRDVLRIGIG
jgi:hypothetical protein